MKFIRIAEPPVLPVIDRTFWGINDALVTIVLSCGHDYAGLAREGYADLIEYPCHRCVNRLVPDQWKTGDLLLEEIPQQMNLFGEFIQEMK